MKFNNKKFDNYILRKFMIVMIIFIANNNLFIENKYLPSINTIKSDSSNYYRINFELKNATLDLNDNNIFENDAKDIQKKSNNTISNQNYEFSINREKTNNTFDIKKHFTNNLTKNENKKLLFEIISSKIVPLKIFPKSEMRMIKSSDKSKLTKNENNLVGNINSIS